VSPLVRLVDGKVSVSIISLVDHFDHSSSLRSGNPSSFLSLPSSMTPLIPQNDGEIIRGSCFEYRLRRAWWTYSWCNKETLEQTRSPRVGKPPIERYHIGNYQPDRSLHKFHQFYESNVTECLPEGQEKLLRRTGDVFLKCCDSDPQAVKVRRKADRKTGAVFIDSVLETKPCHYVFYVCAQSVCTEESSSDLSMESVSLEVEGGVSDSRLPASDRLDPALETLAQFPEKIEIPLPPEKQSKRTTRKESSSGVHPTEITPKEQLRLREKVREMFYHGYDSYLRHAYPQVPLLPLSFPLCPSTLPAQSDLRPLSCSGQRFELIKIPLVTLIDTLDTLVLLGNYSEFKRATQLIAHEIPFFSFDTSVSVFETTIRILGGLLSAHLFAIDPLLGIYVSPSRLSSLLTSPLLVSSFRVASVTMSMTATSSASLWMWALVCSLPSAPPLASPTAP
jgi:hypothetical protein